MVEIGKKVGQINVLKGEMSLIGRRPLQLRDCERLAAADPRGYRLASRCCPA
jgi:lipopolysaccharide/colanic/teichoic acid biosynthesis glycosyltransferase